MTKNLKKQLASYFIFQVVCWVFYMITLSLSTFFHFLLDHKLGVIDDWFFEFGWQLISVAKIMGFVFIISFYTIKFDVKNPLITIFYSGNRKISDRYIKAVFFIITSIVIFGEFAPNMTFNFFKIFASYVSSVIFFIFDVLFIFILHRVWKVSEEEKELGLYLFSLNFIFMNKVSFLFDDKGVLVFLIHILLILKLGLSEKLNWSQPLMYMLMIVGPTVAIIGIDPIWGNDFSPVKAYFGDDLIFLYAILGIAFCYIHLSKIRTKLKLGGYKRGSRTN